MSMESVAARAGVSKVSLYRRWGSKADVAAEVLRFMGESAPVKDCGSLEADLRFLVGKTIRSSTSKTAARMMMRTMGEISDDPDLLALNRERLLAPRVEQARAIVKTARARGELRNGLSVDGAASIIGGPLFLYYLVVLAGAHLTLPKNVGDNLVRTMLGGIAKR